MTHVTLFTNDRLRAHLAWFWRVFLFKFSASMTHTSTRARRRDGFVKGEPLVGHEPHREFFHRTHLLLLAAL